MRKTRILLASLLKPANDVRMFEKLGKSLANLPGTEIHLAGFSAQNLSNSEKLHFHPIFKFRRLSLGRIMAQWKYYKLLLQLKPEVIVATTYELLPVTLLYRIFNRTVILYDIQENYYNNIYFQPTYPLALRWILANGVRSIERLAAPFIRHYLLAEKCYAHELTFLAGNYTVLENKYKSAPENVFTASNFPIKLKPQNLHLLYSGTISEVYGIWEAIKLTDALHNLENRVQLTIIGYCPQESTFEKLQAAIKDKTYIKLIGGNTLVPHAQIVAAMQEATVGLLPYRPNESTRNCLPTKLFEYLANGLIMILPENPLWLKPVAENQAGFSIDFTHPEPEKILNRLLTEPFYADGRPANVFWKSEDEKLLSVFTQKVLKN
ncbi:glycosyltransferase [Adhaeribacter sp. BT258]|uniref:Glycosyltransferase n=1 Tax=Adhaeribacter terrigena TaxID=2793070 RepID=A0ABS1C0W2_9BACT|nr:glycosyltransferase [Adhaeribacter terrigena]MBK0402816.1 glycosyltransferase [Adhaeribacter terrigena]